MNNSGCVLEFRDTPTSQVIPMSVTLRYNVFAFRLWLVSRWEKVGTIELLSVMTVTQVHNYVITKSTSGYSAVR